MARREKQTIEIEKTHRNPLPSFHQAVTSNYSDFLGTALLSNQKFLQQQIEPGCSLAQRVSKSPNRAAQWRIRPPATRKEVHTKHRLRLTTPLPKMTV